jgi:hypothetical protein
MVFLLEEIVVEFVAIAATVVATGLLVAVLIGFALERRPLRAPEPSSNSGSFRQTARTADHPASAQHALVHRS